MKKDLKITASSHDANQVLSKAEDGNMINVKLILMFKKHPDSL